MNAPVVAALLQACDDDPAAWRARLSREPRLRGAPALFWARHARDVRVAALPDGAFACRAGEPAQALFFLLEGRWQTPDGRAVDDPLAGEEVALGQPRFRDGRCAAGDAKVLVIDAPAARALPPAVLDALLRGHLRRHGLDLPPAPAAPANAVPAPRIVAVVGAPLLGVWLAARGVDPVHATVFAVMVPLLGLWAARDWPLYAPALLAALALLLFNAAQPVTLLAGFTNDGFFWLLGACTVSLATVESGLAGLLWARCVADAGHGGWRGWRAQARALLIHLLLVHPAHARRWRTLADSLAPSTPGASDAGQATPWRAGALAARLGCIAAHPLNLLVWAMLPATTSDRFTPLAWTRYLLPLALLALASAWLPRRQREAVRPPPPLAAPRWVFDPATALAVAVGVLLVALASPVHGIAPGMVALYAVPMLLAAAVLPADGFWQRNDWNTLLAFGLVIGLQQVALPVLQQHLLPPVAEHLAQRAPLHAWYLYPCLGVLGCMAAVVPLRRFWPSLPAGAVAFTLALLVAQALQREPWGWLLAVAAMLHLVSHGAECAQRDGEAALGSQGLRAVLACRDVWFGSAALLACAAWWLNEGVL